MCTKIYEKNDKLSSAIRCGNLKLEFGCGYQKRSDEFVGVDAIDTPAVDVVGDALAVLRSISDGCAEAIVSEHFLEHCTDVVQIISEWRRVLSPVGEIEIVVPHYSNAYFNSDPTHAMRFGLYTFCYLANDKVGYSRSVPKYSRIDGLNLVGVDLVFKSPRCFVFRNILRRAFGIIVNSSRYTQEFYEEMLTGLVSCYEVRYRLRK